MADYQKLTKAQLIKELHRLQSKQSISKNTQETHKLRHDLEVHQVELEVQNCELREQQQQLELVCDKYTDLYDFAPIGYLTLDEKGIIREINLTATGLLKRSRDQLLNQPLVFFLSKRSSHDFLRATREIVADLEEQSLELQLLHKDNTRVDVLMQMVPANADGATMIRAVLLDIRAKLQTERELIQAKEQAEKANQAKSQFLNRMSHEFRTPLNSILGFAQILREDDVELTHETKSEYIDYILNSGRHLVELVNHVLDLAKIEAKRNELSIEDIDITERILDSIEVLVPLARKRNIEIQHPDDMQCPNTYVRADALRLKQVLLNLLSNAVKYNHEDGVITVSCKEKRSERIRISVTDTGPGIADQDLPTVFDAFSQIYLNTYAKESTGIGLAISKQLVELMGGTIGIESEFGQGSTFWIELEKSRALS